MHISKSDELQQQAVCSVRRQSPLPPGRYTTVTLAGWAGDQEAVSRSRLMGATSRCVGLEGPM